MHLFRTANGVYINLAQATRFVAEKDRIAIHFGSNDGMALRLDDAKRLAETLADLAATSADNSVPVLGARNLVHSSAA